jgi:hypothetical protein
MGRAFWEAHVEAWRAGKETQAAYCRRLGLSQITFSGWKRRFEREDVGVPASGEAPALLAVEVSDSAPKPEPEGEAGITVEMGDDVRLRLTPDFDAASLTRAVAALRDARR